ncbi:hypothetical protein [Rhodohalobacter mucosus]|uniref:2TM domain-containing protein n=1 Tax=Rhodohalobacter mucosus TaxID=2079485 RepID=A0A316TSD5_9BACT|nr:hypothetical protein [Rhodohalobacter mucosus]PWN05144.1 hypothetical protein DDZ15_15565 [Rhodohalobacter mucosus]
MQYSAEDEERLQTYAHIHLRGKSDLPVTEKLHELQKKVKLKWLQFSINAFVVVVLTYMYFTGSYDLHPLFYYPLSLLFVVNMGLIHFQVRQIRELREYLKSSD